MVKRRLSVSCQDRRLEIRGHRVNLGDFNRLFVGAFILAFLIILLGIGYLT